MNDSRKLNEAWKAYWRIKHLSLKIGKWTTSDEQDIEGIFDYLREVAAENRNGRIARAYSRT